MTELSIKRPEEGEYAPYYGRYVALVPGADVVSALSTQLEETLELLRGVTEERASYRYAEGKWSIKELVGHLIDGERVFAYRALRFARADRTELPGFDQDLFAQNAAYDEQPLAELASEFEQLRRSNLLMFKHLPAEAWDRTGRASDNEISVRALAYIMAGHELHHIRILREKYL